MRSGNFSTVLVCLLLCACAPHLADCAVGFAHADCEPGTAGYQSEQNLESQDETKCIHYGFQAGTPGFAQCRMLAVQAREQADALQDAANRARVPGPP